MLDLLMPAAVAAVEAYDDDGNDGNGLYAEEAAIVARAVDRRRREFTTARACARRALHRLGLPPAPILPGERGAPTWPAGVVGSMTHCDGYRAAALAHGRDVRTIGIDAEPDAPLPAGVLDAIGLAQERAMVRRLTADAPGPCWDRLLFSAKESVYKAWFPLARTFLDFAGARIAFDPDAGTFVARILVPGPVAELTGRWHAARGLVVTAIVVPAQPEAQPEHDRRCPPDDQPKYGARAT